MNQMAIKIYCDDTHEGLWFRELDPDLRSADLVTMKGRGSNPPAIDNLLMYDRPDIIVVRDGEPFLVLEKTTEVPTGHNIGQRMGRIVRAAEQGVPVVKFLPFDAKKHGKHAAMCNLNVRLLDAFRRMAEIHATPVVAVNWPCDDEGELVRDGQQDKRLAEIIRAYCASGRTDIKEFAVAMEDMVAEYSRRVKAFPNYGKPPSSVEIQATSSVVSEVVHRGGARPDATFTGRPETVVYTIEMTPEACRREDPYTGMQFVYDYQLCRTGPQPREKCRNLIINCPLVSISRWLEANPNDPKRKSCLWYATANGILLKDGFIRIVP